MGTALIKSFQLWINPQTLGADQPLIQVFETKSQLIAELMDFVANGKRCFVAANSKKLIGTLHAALRERYGEGRRMIEITSGTTESESVQTFIADVQTKALEYDVVLASPSIGTGVDISFPNKAKLVDAVFGFFEAGVTNHKDCDQQMGRVRHPGEVKVWISPRRFNQEITFEVVKRDVLEDGLYKCLLVGFDADDIAMYDENDEFIHMAAMVTSEDRASKNNLKKNFVEHKKRQGHAIEFVPENDDLKAAGKDVLKLGKTLTRETMARAIMSASTLPKVQFDHIREALQDNGSVSDSDKHDYHRTRLELFYREPVSEALIEVDDVGNYRERVRLYEDVTQPWVDTVSSSMLAKRSRMVKSHEQKVKAMLLLLMSTPIFRDNKFDPAVEITQNDLTEFVQIICERKAEFENLLGLDIRADIQHKAVQQLTAVLKRVGLRMKPQSSRKIGGRKIYSYRVDINVLRRIDTISMRRINTGGWQYLYQAHGWELNDLGEDEYL